jgi:hypothetical protein
MPNGNGNSNGDKKKKKAPAKKSAAAPDKPKNILQSAESALGSAGKAVGDFMAKSKKAKDDIWKGQGGKG